MKMHPTSHKSSAGTCMESFVILEYANRYDAYAISRTRNLHAKAETLATPPGSRAPTTRRPMPALDVNWQTVCVHPSRTRTNKASRTPLDPHAGNSSTKKAKKAPFRFAQRAGAN